MLPKEYSLLWPLVRVSETYFLPPPVPHKGGFADIAWRMVPLQACPKATACREAFFLMRVGRLTHTWDWLLVTHLTPAPLAERWRGLRRELNQSPNAVSRRPTREPCSSRCPPQAAWESQETPLVFSGWTGLTVSGSARLSFYRRCISDYRGPGRGLFSTFYFPWLLPIKQYLW